MSYDPRIPVSRLNYAVVIGLRGFEHATENYRYEPRLDAIDDAAQEAAAVRAQRGNTDGSRLPD